MRTSHLQRTSVLRWRAVPESRSVPTWPCRVVRCLGVIEKHLGRGFGDQRVAVRGADGHIVANDAGGFAILHVNNEKWRVRAFSCIVIAIGRIIDEVFNPAFGP